MNLSKDLSKDSSKDSPRICPRISKNLNLFQSPRVFLPPQSEPKIRNSSLHSGASSGTLQFEPWRTTQSKAFPFSVSIWTLAPNQIFKKSGEGYGQNAQKCRHMDFESLPKWNPNWHPKYLSGDMSGNLGVPKALPKWNPLKLYFMRQHDPSWGLRFWVPNRFFTIWGRPPWNRIWTRLQNRYCHFRKHSVEAKRSLVLKIHFGRGVQAEANLRSL